MHLAISSLRLSSISICCNPGQQILSASLAKTTLSSVNSAELDCQSCLDVESQSLGSPQLEVWDTTSTQLAVTPRQLRRSSRVCRTFRSVLQILTCIIADVSQASRKIQNELPGREKEAEKKGQAMLSEAGTKFDKAVREAIRPQQHLC